MCGNAAVTLFRHPLFLSPDECLLIRRAMDIGPVERAEVLEGGDPHQDSGGRNASLVEPPDTVIRLVETRLDACRQLEREELEVSNREQQRIGSDLHDGLGQELTGIALLLRGLENRAEREAPALSASIEEVALLVNDAIFTTRALARGLSPVTFDRGGLSNALDELAKRLSAMFHIDVRCEADDSLDANLDPANALHLYRIAQEAVTNAAQHGEATHVRIMLRADGDRGLLRIEDDGSGFNPALLQAKGLGLRIMRYRAQMMAGSLRIENARGTAVNCWFPR